MGERLNLAILCYRGENPLASMRVWKPSLYLFACIPRKLRTPRFRIPCTLKKLSPYTPPRGHSSSLQIVHAPNMVEDYYY